MPQFKSIRILLLLTALFCVTAVATQQYIGSRSWTTPLETVIYPINGDGYHSTQAYINTLDTSDFNEIDRWFFREARRYDLALDYPVKVTLGSAINTLPPELPEQYGALRTIFWGLKFRWWAWRNTPDTNNKNLVRIRLFVLYYQGEGGKPLAHSLGLQKGLLGLVHAFGLPQQTQQNNIVIAHELLHTVGAVDKYDVRGLPLYPEGYANPSRLPLFPQQRAEIMAGRIPNSYSQATMAATLDSVIINPQTAAEINWLPIER